MSFTPPILLPPNQMMPPEAFDHIINQLYIRVHWLKGHSCPCASDTGNANPLCPTCLGRSIFWDPPTANTFNVLLTFVHLVGRTVDVGDQVDPSYGILFEGHPIITIPETASPLYEQVGLFDALVEADSLMRFQTTLRVDQNTTLLHGQLGVTQNLTVAPTGAVLLEDISNNVVVSGVSYTVSGTDVFLNGIYTEGTGYVVEYYANPLWVIEERFGGLAHIRPFAGITYPKRFKAKWLTLWLQNKMGFSTSIKS